MNKKNLNNEENNKIEKKIKLLFGLFFLAMILALGFSIYMFTNSFSSKKFSEETTTLNPYEEKNKKNEVTYTEGNHGEYSQENSLTSYNNAILKAQRGDFEGVLNDITKIKAEYKLTKDYNKDLINVYMDANVIKNIKSMEIPEQEQSLYDGMNDLKMKSIGFFWLSNRAKALTTIKNDSICPEALKTIEFQDYEVKDLNKVNENDDTYIKELQTSLNTSGYYLNSIKDEIEPNVYICYLQADKIPITMYLVKRLDNLWIMYGIEYRNEDTINENWKDMSYYYIQENYLDNSKEILDE